MKIPNALLLALFPQTVAAFIAIPLSTTKSSSRILSTQPQRQQPLMGYLDDIASNSETHELESTDPAVRFDEYMANVEAAFSRTQRRIGNMQVEERRSHEAVQAVEERMK